MVTEIFPTDVTPPAVTASEIVIDGHAVARPKVLDIEPTLDHISGYFVADNPRQLVTRTAFASAPAETVPHQGKSQTAGPNLDKDLVGTWLWPRRFLQDERTARFLQYQGPHACTSLTAIAAMSDGGSSDVLYADNNTGAG